MTVFGECNSVYWENPTLLFKKQATTIKVSQFFSCYAMSKLSKLEISTGQHLWCFGFAQALREDVSHLAPKPQNPRGKADLRKKNARLGPTMQYLGGRNPTYQGSYLQPPPAKILGNFDVFFWWIEKPPFSSSDYILLGWGPSIVSPILLSYTRDMDTNWFWWIPRTKF